MTRGSLVLVGIGGFLALAWACVSVSLPQIERDLVSRARAELDTRELRWARVSASGRDLTLAGIASTDALRSLVEHVVSDVSGVRRVENWVEVRAHLPRNPATRSFVDPSTQCAREIEAALRGREIEFTASSVRIQPSSLRRLDAVARVLLRYSTLHVEVRGHTDSQGRDDYNLRLSERRARAVAAYLASQGVAEQRLTARGLGETEPVAPNQNREGRARNRRIEFQVRESE